MPKSKDLAAGFQLTFAEGLSMHGDAAEKLTERLSRFASGAAYVSAHGGGEGVDGAVWSGLHWLKHRTRRRNTNYGCAITAQVMLHTISGRCRHQRRRR